MKILPKKLLFSEKISKKLILLLVSVVDIRSIIMKQNKLEQLDNLKGLRTD